MRENLKYSQRDANHAEATEKEIPLNKLHNHLDCFEEFPQIFAGGTTPSNNVPTTFGTSSRFKDPQLEYTQEAMKLSMLDYHDSVFTS